MTPCPVCAGAGWWDRLTGQPVDNRGQPDHHGLTRCPYCEGKGAVPLREPPKVY